VGWGIKWAAIAVLGNIEWDWELKCTHIWNIYIVCFYHTLSVTILTAAAFGFFVLLIVIGNT